MKLWSDLPNRLVEQLPIWRVVFMIFLSFDIALSNMVPDRMMTNPSSAFVLLAVFVSSVFLLSKDFSRRLASGHQQLSVQADKAFTGPQRALGTFRWLAPFTRYAVMLLVFLAISGAFSEWIEYALPGFSSDQDIGIPQGNVWIGLGAAFLGCLEEYWRWSMIVTVLVVFKGLSRRRFAEQKAFRNIAFVAAIVVSSLVFGLGHYEEFTTYKGWSYIVLGAMGIVLALSAIVTRRFLVAVLLHYLYDFLAISGLFDVVHIVLYTVAGILAVLTLPPFFLLLRKLWPYLNASLLTAEAHEVGSAGEGSDVR